MQIEPRHETDYLFKTLRAVLKTQPPPPQAPLVLVVEKKQEQPNAN